MRSPVWHRSDPCHDLSPSDKSCFRRYRIDAGLPAGAKRGVPPYIGSKGRPWSDSEWPAAAHCSLRRNRGGRGRCGREERLTVAACSHGGRLPMRGTAAGGVWGESKGILGVAAHAWGWRLGSGDVMPSLASRGRPLPEQDAHSPIGLGTFFECRARAVGLNLLPALTSVTAVRADSWPRARFAPPRAQSCRSAAETRCRALPSEPRCLR